MAKQSGFESLWKSVSDMPGTFMDVIKSFGSKGKGGAGFIGSMADMGAKQVSRTMNAGQWVFRTFPLLATGASLILFWKPIKNSFKRVFGMGHHHDAMQDYDVRTPRQMNPYVYGNEAGPARGKSANYWQSMVAGSRGKNTEYGA